MKAKTAQAAPETAMPEIKHCGCCGKVEEQVERRTRWGYTAYTESDLTTRARGFELCPPCLAGYESGEYAAVGLGHELRGIKRGHTFTVQKPMTLAQLMKVVTKAAAKTAEHKQWLAELAA